MPERATVMNRSEKSAEVIVAARRRTEREGESTAMSLGTARHQKPGQPGRTAEGEGEARPEAFRDEAGLARHESEGSGRADLLGQVLARGNLVAAWKRVNPNIGCKCFVGVHVHNRPPGCYLSHQGHAVLSSAKAI